MVIPSFRSLARVARSLARRSIAVALVASLASLVPSGIAATPASSGASQPGTTCQLPGQSGTVQHVIFIQFDNVHFTRDNPNVPSDLEQMPNLLNFLTSNGVLLSDEQTPLISHTADDTLTSLTGVYGDGHGMPVANTYDYYNPNGTVTTAGSFAYWTDPVVPYAPGPPTDSLHTLVNQQGLNAPAPWVPYTRAGCNVGIVALTNMELENTSPDVALVYGANSPQASEAQKNPKQATADFMGIAVHCAAGSSTCSTGHGAVPDVLPSEPNGYAGFNALYGHEYVAPVISPNGPFEDLFGRTVSGFPGYNGMTPAVSLAYTLDMQEQGIPVTFAYITAAHENSTSGRPWGPGEADYVQQLQQFNSAFGTFFQDLTAAGITPANTLFVITADEGDHFVGGAPTPSNCDGVTTACTYSQIGELDANVTGLLATQQNVQTSFTLHQDMTPGFYLTGNPADNASTTRALDRAVALLTVNNLLTGATDNLALYLADASELKILHMVTGDPLRTPTMVAFANPDYWVVTGANKCSPPCVSENAGEAWNHGGISPDVNTTWLGLVGPGVQNLGVDGSVWSDHTDIRPTMLELVGLTDDYTHEGRVLAEVLTPAALPSAIQPQEALYVQLAQTFKQIDAPLGQLGQTSLAVSTTALASGTPSDDSLYTCLEGQLSSVASTRDALAAQMLAVLEGAAFQNQAIDPNQAQQLISQGQALLNQVSGLKNSCTGVKS